MQRTIDRGAWRCSLDHHGNLALHLRETRFILSLNLLLNELVSQDFFQDPGNGLLTAVLAVVLKRNEDRQGEEASALLCFGNFLIDLVSDGLYDVAEGDLGGQGQAMCDLWLVVILLVVPDVDLDAAAADAESVVVGQGGSFADELRFRVRVPSGTVSSSAQMQEAYGSVAHLSSREIGVVGRAGKLERGRRNH